MSVVHSSLLTCHLLSHSFMYPLSYAHRMQVTGQLWLSVSSIWSTINWPRLVNPRPHFVQQTNAWLLSPWQSCLPPYNPCALSRLFAQRLVSLGPCGLISGYLPNRLDSCNTLWPVFLCQAPQKEIIWVSLGVWGTRRRSSSRLYLCDVP